MKTILTALMAAVLAATPATAQGWAEKMVQGSPSHDFGVVPRGAQLFHRFTITNIYAVRMEITGLHPGCGCVTAVAPKRILEPRESTTIDISMDAARFTGPKTVSIRVTVGPEYVSSTELKVIANSRADVVFNPGQVSFGTVTRGQAVAQTIDVEYAGPLAWQVSEVVVPKELPVEVTFKDLYRKPGKIGVQLRVVLKADAAPGGLKDSIYLKTNDPAAPLVPVLVEANVLAALTVSPEVLPLPNLKAGEVKVVRVQVRGNRPFRVLGVEGGAEVVLAGEAGPAAPVQTVLLKCQFGQPGDFKREVQIRTDLQPAPVVVVIEGSVAP
jgi:hypothetical protein